MQIGFPSLLFVVFLVLKLTGVIAWSWLWVTAPLWIGFAIAIPLMVLQYLALRSFNRSFEGRVHNLSRSVHQRF